MCIYKTKDGKCEKFSDDKVTSFCVEGPCEYEKLSNYDRIKAMSVEEMTIFLYQNVADCDMCPATKSCEASTELSCKERILEWLESEAENDG